MPMINGVSVEGLRSILGSKGVAPPDLDRLKTLYDQFRKYTGGEDRWDQIRASYNRPQSLLQTEHEARMQVVVDKLTQTIGKCDSLKHSVDQGRCGREEIRAILQDVAHGLELLIPLVKDRPPVPQDRREMFISGNPDDLARSGPAIRPRKSAPPFVSTQVVHEQDPEEQRPNIRSREDLWNVYGSPNLISTGTATAMPYATSGESNYVDFDPNG